MKYSKITGTLLNFQNGQRMDTGVAYSSQETNSEKHQIVIRTYENKKIIETVLTLEGPDFLSFRSHSDDVRIPMITGRFWSSDYEDSVLSATLTDQKISISGVITKLDPLHALSTKTLTEISSGKVVGVMQERIQLISESEFKAAVHSK